MKILVLSDSHSGMRFMRQCVETIKPQAVVHLGDYYDDGETLKELYPHIELHQVPGNCDRYRCPPWVHAVLCYDVCGVRLFMTHGHKHNVKITTGLLLAEAVKNNAAAALYGHTHIADCRKLSDGMWVLNPGACGSFGGSAGVIETDGNKITACYLVKQAAVEDNA
jgi:putative phosphoesterase